jgi:hypothetical protein
MRFQAERAHRCYDEALAMLSACGLKAVPAGVTPVFSMTIGDSDDESIAKEPA